MVDIKSVARKRCSKCGETKELVAGFYRDGRKIDGRRSQCKACANASNAKWYTKNPEYHATKAAKEKENRNQINRRRRARYAKDPEARRERNRAWRSANLGQAAESSARYVRRHPDRIKARSAVAHAIAAGKLIAQSCQECGREPEIINGKQCIQAHHHKGYAEEFHLDVIWQCRQTCHRD